MKKLVSLLLAVMLMCSVAFAADYPTKGIDVICPWAAGGGTDACLRALCMAAEKVLGQTMTVENRTGGGGIIGHSAIQTARPDGYTIGMITFELSTYDALGAAEMNYNDFALLCRVNTDASAITVNTAWAQANNITDLNAFVDFVKANPGAVNVGVSAVGSVWQIGAGLFATEAGLDYTIVPYPDGAAAATTSVAGGHIEAVAVSLAEVRSQVDAGNLTILGVMDNTRSSLYPDVPTFQECGYDIEYGTWRGMAVSKDTDPEIVEILSAAFETAVEDPDFVEFMNNAGQKIAYLNAADFEAFLAQNYADVSSTLEALGLTEDA
ncbi:MAG: tripartite tricarboxylate transporter substrate binding protein [Clostridia bacterium]|nr:tripartite tricarboxylate transporter substrate binding protein [Clostridia bacterium]